MQGGKWAVGGAGGGVGGLEGMTGRGIWSGGRPAVKRGAGYRIDVMHLDRVMVELEAGVPGQGTTPNTSMLDWLEEVDQWKREVATNPGLSASELVIEDRRARR